MSPLWGLRVPELDGLVKQYSALWLLLSTGLSSNGQWFLRVETQGHCWCTYYNFLRRIYNPRIHF